MVMPARKFSVCLTFDFDAMSAWVGTVKTRNPSMVSRGEFGAVAVPRILALLAKYDIEASFAIPGHTALAFPDLVREIRDGGHEIVHHGWVHENPADFDEAGERNILDQGLAALHKTAGVTPRGYRSPAWDVSTRTISLLREYGFLYDSSFMGNDYSPYYLRDGDSWSLDGPYVFGKPTDLVEIPVAWHLDDFPQMEFVPGFGTTLNPPSIVEEVWRGDFDWGYANIPGGLLDITMHPQVIGRGHRLLMLERLIVYYRSHVGVAFESLGKVAARWKVENPPAL
jgi:peptidoglycan/xylan/chitin deacetylase (PgdA/CDA1 family)